MSSAYTATVQAAIHAWAVAGSGLAAANVLWSRQDVARPSTPYINLHVLALVSIGNDFVDHEYDAGGDPGEEIIYHAYGMRRLTLSIQCFGGESVISAGPTPFSILDQLKARTAFPTVRAALNTGGIGLAELGAVAVLEGSTNQALLEPRATMEFGAHLASDVTELGTFIEFVQITNNIADPASELWVPLDPSP